MVGTIITAATFPFLVCLGVDIYGLWSYVVAVCGFTGLLANPGLTAYAAQQVAARRAEAFQTISDVLVLRAFAGAVAAVAVLVVARLKFDRMFASFCSSRSGLGHNRRSVVGLPAIFAGVVSRPVLDLDCPARSLRGRHFCERFDLLRM